MARDYTKYSVKNIGENLNKRQLVFEIVKDYVNKNKPSFEELIKIFPDEIQGSKGVIKKESEVKDAKRYNMREPLAIKNGALVVVSNQWGSNISDFIKCATDHNYEIEIVSQSSDDDELKIIDSSTDFVGSNDVSPKIKLPKNFFPNFKLEWGRLISFRLENNDDDYFYISLDMMTNEVVGDGEVDNINSRWFYSNDISLWEGHVEYRSYDGVLDISCEDEDSEWSIKCHGGFEELEDGDLPPSTTGNDIWDALGDGQVIYKLYEFVKANAV